MLEYPIAVDEEDPSRCSVCGAAGHSCSPAMLGSGVKIVRLTDGEKERSKMHVLAERTYVNADSTKVVAEGSPEAAYLLGHAGEEISDETAKRLGLGTEVPTVAGYSSMKVDDLRTVASERGLEVEGGAKAKKADLVAALEADDQAKKTASSSSDAGDGDQGDGEDDDQA